MTPAPVRIVIGTFGKPEWIDRAKVAMASAAAQTTPCDVVHVHAANLAAARNIGAAGANNGWLVFLDADDALDTRYVEKMLVGTGDLRQPATLGVYPDGREDPAPNVIPPRVGGMARGNHLVIGTMVRADLFHAVGGFRDIPVLDDYDLWLRCIIKGGQLGVVPEAIYRVGVNEGSRNDPKHEALHRSVYQDIQARYGPHLRTMGL